MIVGEKVEVTGLLAKIEVKLDQNDKAETMTSGAQIIRK
jgi:hypothetical protein